MVNVGLKGEIGTIVDELISLLQRAIPTSEELDSVARLVFDSSRVLGISIWAQMTLSLVCSDL